MQLFGYYLLSACVLSFGLGTVFALCNTSTGRVCKFKMYLSKNICVFIKSDNHSVWQRRHPVDSFYKGGNSDSEENQWELIQH